MYTDFAKYFICMWSYYYAQSNVGNQSELPSAEVSHDVGIYVYKSQRVTINRLKMRFFFRDEADIKVSIKYLPDDVN
jgi:hypothetical protein